MSHRQQVLVLYTATSALDTPVVGWSLYDALRDGWRLFHASQLDPPHPDAERQVSYLEHEFWFERFADAPPHQLTT